MMNKKEPIKAIKDYIQDGIEQSVKYLEGPLLAGKIAAYNDVYDYIIYILEGDIKEDAES